MSTRRPPISNSRRRTCAALTMPPALASPADYGIDLVDAFVAHLRATGRRTDPRYARAAERFVERWPDPQSWAAEPLSVRLGVCARTRQLVVFLMLHRHLRPGYDYLLSRTLLSLWRELPSSPLQADMQRFVAAARRARVRRQSGARGGRSGRRKGADPVRP